MINFRPRAIFFVVFFSIALFHICSAQNRNIKNDTFWHTADGETIFSQGGGIFTFADPLTGKPKYYWYGVHYEEADLYRKNPAITHTKSTFKAVTCYSSTDLVNWKFEKNVLTTKEVEADGKKTWVGRLGVAYLKEIKKYAMFVQHGGKVLITVSESPTGEFKWHQEISMEQMIGTLNTGDQTVFTDDDGKSYLVYSYGRGRNKIYLSEIGLKNGKVDLLNCNKIFEGESREGNCMFKYKGKYYMCASNIYGWDASFAYYLVADQINGPYLPTNKMKVMDGCEDDFAHVTQTGFFVTVKGSEKETVLYCGDRWSDFAGNGLGYNQWFPLSFNHDVPYFNSLGSWNIDAKTGNWTVANDNDYVKNGSFEADRRHIPSHVKPVQTFLTGWNTIILYGNKIELDSTKSPVLNFFNTEADRQLVVGEKSLNISDKVKFGRKVSQVISSSPDVKLTDGFYCLTAKVKNSGGFSELAMYAESNGKKFGYDLKNENTTWKSIVLDQIAVKNGQVEIGFSAKGEANAFCLIDDVSLVKVK